MKSRTKVLLDTAKIGSIIDVKSGDHKMTSDDSYRPRDREPFCICFECKKPIRLEDAIQGYPPFHKFGVGPRWYGPVCAKKLGIVRTE